MKKTLVALAALFVLGFLVAGGTIFYLESSVSSPGTRTGTVVFTVPKGAHATAVGSKLLDEGLIPSTLVWRYHIKRRGGLKLKAGRFELRGDMSLRELALALEQSPLADDEPLKVLEGWRLRDTDAALAAKGWIQPGAYIEAASRPSAFKAPFALPQRSLEGYLYPETYAINPNQVDLDKLIQRQLDTFVERFYQAHARELEASTRSLHAVVTMASMLEREEPMPEQRPVVAGILWKRIDHDTPLGVDATSRYELDEWNDRAAFLKHLRDPDDPYNSRLRKGLPPTPIGAPTVDSLVAALKPTPGPYWYYLHDKDRVLHPSKDAAEHEALRKKYGVY